jgi:CubicO group peptidase (beta-lactamase class C family)
VCSAFGIGYAVPVRGDGMAGVGSFGHGGAGGSTGFAHPDHELAIGFTTSHVPSIAGHDPAVDELTAVVLRCAGIEVTSRC